jgi:hypothetical protein
VAFVYGTAVPLQLLAAGAQISMKTSMGARQFGGAKLIRWVICIKFIFSELYRFLVVAAAAAVRIQATKTTNGGWHGNKMCFMYSFCGDLPIGVDYVGIYIATHCTGWIGIIEEMPLGNWTQ